MLNVFTRYTKLFLNLVFAMCICSVTATLFGQVEQGRFVGRVTDPTGAAIVGATVTARNVDTNIELTGTTNSTGDYVITPVPAGNYALSVAATGFEKAVTKAIELQVGQIARQDVAMAIGTATTEVQVNTAAPLLTTETATIGQVITNKQLSDLPVNGRGFYRLAELTPGAVLLGATGNSLPIRPEIVNGNVISGIRGSATSFLMDGVDTSEQHQGGTFIQASIDALQEFSIVQSPYSAEYNRGGAFFNATTKAGTNHFHGGLYDFLRNDALDARNYFALTRQILKRNQFGANLGGPLSVPGLYQGKDRTFFFFSYEGQRLRQGIVENGIVPTDAMRAGNFSGVKKIFDPLSPQRAEFQNDTIPTSRLSQQALAILNYYPHQNTAAGTFSAVPSQAIDYNQYITRLDDQVTTKNRLFARWIYMQQHEVDPNFSPALKTANLNSIGQDIAVGLISNIGNTMVNEIRTHFLPSHVRLQAFLQGPDFNGSIGVTGLSDLLRNGAGSFPDYSWSGYASLQGSTFDQRPKSQDRKAWEITDDYTILKGRQSLKFGVLIRYYQWLGYDSQTYAGLFSFNGSETGDAFADFLLGYPSSVGRAYPGNNFGGEGWYKQFFAQDDIRVNSRLTVNMGLRYEYSPWLEGYKGQVGTFDPSQTKPVIVAGNGTTPDLTAQPAAQRAYAIFGQYIQTSSTAHLPYNITYTDKKQFGPRMGVSFQADPKTVFRAGIGIFYEPEGTSGRVNLNMLPFRLNETQNQNQNIAPTRTLADFFLGAPLSSASANPSLVPTKTHMSVGRNVHYSFDMQRQFSSRDVFDIGYVGNRGVHLNASNDFNDPPPGPGPIQARRPYQPWGTISFNTQDLSQSYNSLQTKFEHRFSHQFMLLTSYTWSKLLAFNQSPALGGNTGYEKTYSGSDVPHQLAISGIYALPVGHGKAFLSRSNAFVDEVLGGWQAQTIVVLRSGTPYTPTIGGDRANTGVGGQRPNPNPAKCDPNFRRSLKAWFDKGCYVDAPSNSYGTLRANTLRADVSRQVDASLFKNFALPGESTLSF
ncbi:MAG TPA: carboxypeptidase regulatory-like domain-containing protein, partial [Acidobacteriaceae bacterium]|nr:carboxypeptidase regulatory-like domain-containing protein [Acidobacteriaceae bacterium]